MATKRETPVKKKARKKTVDAAEPAAFDGIAAIAPEDPEIKTTSVDDDPEVRRRLIAMEAYYLAERRGFVAGHEVEDWTAAEAVVRSRDSANPR
jgi:hypothetical protein